MSGHIELKRTIPCDDIVVGFARIVIALISASALFAQTQPQPPARPAQTALQPSTAPTMSALIQDLVTQGNKQLEAGQYDAAISTFQNLIPQLTKPADKAGAWSRIADAFRAKGDYALSVKAMREAEAILPGNALVLTNLGLLYEAMNDKPRARQYYERTLAVDANNPLVLNNLAYLLSDTNGDLDLALSYARAARAKVPNFMEVTDTIGWIYLKKNMVTDAIGEFKLATETKPENPIYHYHYAMALNKQGNQSDATKQCQAGLDNHPKDDLKEQIKQECAGRLQ